MDYNKLSRVTDSANKKESRNRSIKDSNEHFSPQMEELVEAFDNMDDEVDETVVTVSEEIPQEEIDEFVSRYMEHNPEGEEEFILTITPLGNKQYKISCPYVWDKTHSVSDSAKKIKDASEYTIEPGEQDFTIEDVSPEEAAELDKRTNEAAREWAKEELPRLKEEYRDGDYNGKSKEEMTDEDWEDLLSFHMDEHGPYNYSGYDEDKRQYNVWITNIQ